MWKVKGAITLCILLLVSFSISAQNIIINAPATVEAGEEFIVKVKLPKNCFSGISRFSLDFPKEFNVIGKNIDNATFKFENGVAVFQWLTYPDNKDIELSVKVSVPLVAQGHYVIKPAGSYIKDSEMQKVVIEPVVVSVLPSVNVNSTNTAEQPVFTYKQFMSEGIACIRQVPYLEGDDIIVNLLISKGDLINFGKIEERIPTGYAAVNIKSNNAMFIFNKNMNIVKYMWMNMPDKAQFLVSYKLVKNDNYDENIPFLIYGTFQYADDSKTKTVDTQQRGVSFDLVNF